MEGAVESAFLTLQRLHGELMVHVDKSKEEMKSFIIDDSAKLSTSNSGPRSMYIVDGSARMQMQDTQYQRVLVEGATLMEHVTKKLNLKLTESGNRPANYQLRPANYQLRPCQQYSFN